MDIDPIEIVLDHLSVVRVEPRDTLVFRLPYKASVDEIRRIGEVVRSKFGDEQGVLVLEAGTELSVLREGG